MKTFQNLANAVDTCPHPHEPKTRDEFQATTTNQRPWPEADLEIGECRGCQTTVSFPLESAGLDLSLKNELEWLDRRARDGRAKVVG